MPTIYIDNTPYTVKEEGKNLLEVCLSLGFDLPYFCWHPALHSAGACRQCAVKMYKNENDTRGKIVMACMTPATDGTRISIDDPEAVAFRKGVAEWLMVNHPHDCPVCDEGGECHLQDMTLMTGQDYRRFRFRKRTHSNQNLGPFVNHEMNRCIQCYRCVRFYREFAGGHDLDVFGWHDHLYFGRFADGKLENPFSGNLVEVCPTGVFTDKTFKTHYVRKWDLQTSPSICVHCGLGCNIIPGERYGMLRRIRNRYHSEVNGYFLCDRGRFGYEFVNSPERIREPLLRRDDDALQPALRTAVRERLAQLLRPGRVIGIGSPRASLESNFALQTLVGRENFYHGVTERAARLAQVTVEILRQGPARGATQQDVANSDAILLLGEDVVNTAPMLALALRQAALRQPRETILPAMKIPPFDDLPAREAIQEARGPVYIAAPDATWLDDEATVVYRAAPDDLARLGFAVAHAIDDAAPAVQLPDEKLQRLAEEIAGALKAAKRPVIISGYGCGSEAVMQAAANVAWALHQRGTVAQLCFTTPQCNSLGLALLDGAPISEALDALRQDKVDTVIVLENDLCHALDAPTAEAIFAQTRHLVALDHLRNETTRRAEVVLPASAFAEADGTLVNHEGRAQRFFQVYVPESQIQESWRWLGDLLPLMGRQPEMPWQSLDDVMAALAESVPTLRDIPRAAPAADFRLDEQKIPRQSHRASGRTAVSANITVHEPPPPRDPDSPLAFSMEGYQGKPPAPLVPRFWSPGWNSMQAVLRYQTFVNGPLRGGPAGRRLIEPFGKRATTYFSQPPAAFTPRVQEWLIVPAYHLFGSEELSRHAPGIAALTPQPYLIINAADAGEIGVTEGRPVVLVVDEHVFQLPVRLSATLPSHLAALPVGLPDLRGMVLPAWGRLLPVEPAREGTA